MKTNDLVEYQIDHGVYGIGRIISLNEATEIVTVLDEADGSTWTGLMDYVTPA